MSKKAGGTPMQLQFNGKRLLTLFPRLKPVLLRKDVGLIPFSLASECGWKSSLAFFESNDCPQEQLAEDCYDRFVTLVSLGSYGGRLANALRIFRFFMTRGKQFDVVNFYHDAVKDLFYALVYKLFNPRGKVWFKLDMSHLELQYIAANRQRFLPGLARRLKYQLSRVAVDLYTTETSQVFRALADDYYYKGRLRQIRNGIVCPEETDIERLMNGKENIILTVGNLGAAAKNNELLIDAVALLDPTLVNGWQVYLVGPLVNADFYETGFRESDHFRKYVNTVIERHPHLAETFVFTGNISDRSRLDDIYGKARIFCLTSRYESFGFVLPEAMFSGAYVIASDLPPMRDLTDNGRLGALFPVGCAQKLAALLTEALSGRVDLETQGKAAHLFIMEKFNWRNIVREIDHLLS